MALCFFAVIILSFFTGIAIGYILFEFYVMTRKDINFYFVEGDEVNNFLEEIRRSKDNGARMLNYDINMRNNRGTISQTISNGRVRPRSLSSILRGDAPEEPVLAGPITHETEPTENAQFIEETGKEEFFNISNIENDIMENLTDENDESVPDEDFLKKYYKDDYENTEVSDSEDKSDEIKTQDIEDEFSEYNDIVKDNQDFESSPNNEVQSADAIEIAEPSDDVVLKDSDDFTDDMLSDLMDLPDTENKSEENLVTDNKTVTEEKLEEEKKNDKIESNVCIQLGGSTTGVGIGINSSSGSFVSIPLTMTEKLVEPETPPKRKRGRPRKNKK